MERRGWLRRLAGFVVPVLCAAGGCRESAFAPQDGIIDIVITGSPADPGITVTAYVQDRVAPFNRVMRPVAMGGSTRFSGLGAGFDVLAGVEDLGVFRCSVVDRRNTVGASLRAGTEMDVTTRPT